MANIPGLSSASWLLRRMWAAALAGMQFGGKRDLYEVYGYPRNLMPEDMLAKYERQDIAARVVDSAPEEMWTNPPKVEADDAFKKAWEDFVSKTGLWAVLTQADKLCSFSHFSALWVGIPGQVNQAARNNYKVDDVLYLNAYGARSVEVTDYEHNVRDPRYGRPIFYQFKVAEAVTPVKVHWSRVVHIVDRPLQGDLISNPRMANVFNLLEDLLKISGGSAETYWLTSNRGMQVDVDKDMELQQSDADALSEELDEFQHQLRRYIRTRGVKISPLGADVADPKGVFQTLISLLSSATGIPQRMLMGAEAGQLASEQDRANWAQHIAIRRKAFAEPYILRPLTAKLEQLGILPKSEVPVGYVWPEAFHLSPLERAQTMAQTARATVNLSKQAQLGFPLLTREECRTILGQPEEVPEGQDLPEAFKKPDAGGADPSQGRPGNGNNRRQQEGAQGGDILPPVVN